MPLLISTRVLLVWQEETWIWLSIEEDTKYLNAAQGQPPINDNNYQTEASTENIIGDDNNHLGSGN